MVLKKVIMASALSALLVSSLYADKCVCFELKGEFGDEVAALLKKYMKNMGDQNITVVREEVITDRQKQSFVDSLVGIVAPPAASPTGEYDLSAGKAFYDKQCATCHGLDGKEKAYGTSRPIAGMSEADVYAELRKYQDSSYSGGARFIKQTIAQPMTHSLMRNVGAYIQSLAPTK